MRRLTLALCLTAAACSPAPHDRDDPPRTMLDVSENAAPGLRVSAAPGVAFNYRYDFRLPGTEIAAVQERHAAACEKLGLARCRISGLRYSVNDRDRISGTLELKLAPDIARAYGKEGIAAVLAAKGSLSNAEITGVAVGSQITAGNNEASRLRADLADIEKQLATGQRSARERVALQEQADRLRAELRRLSADKADKQQSLATTPMSFSYRSGSPLGILDTTGTITQAIDTARWSFLAIFSLMIVALGALGPWVLIGGALVWAGRKLALRFGRRPVAV